MVQDAAGTPLYFLVYIRDVSERKILEEQLRQAQKMEAVGQLAGGMAHDFNNLLTAIIGNTELLLGTIDLEDLRRLDVLEINRAAHRAATLVRQLLAFSRKQVLQPRIVDLNTVVARAVARCCGGSSASTWSFGSSSSRGWDGCSPIPASWSR